MAYLLREQSYLILAGHELEVMTWKDELRGFWELYLRGDPSHPMNCAGAPPKEVTVPFYIHGDEGRGKYKSPIMIQAVQPVLSFKGPAFKNSSGCLDCSVGMCNFATSLLLQLRHSFCTRFLYAVLPSELYWNDESLKCLNEFFAADLNKAFEEGVLATRPFATCCVCHEVDSRNGPIRVYASMCGVKGDWPYLRKVSG